MTQTEGNHGSDRRQTQDIRSNVKAPSYTQEGVREETEAEKQREEELLSSRQADPKHTNKTTAIAIATMTNRAEMYGGSNSSLMGYNKDSRNHDGEEAAGEATLAQTWPTPKESTAATMRSSSGGSGVTTTQATLRAEAKACGKEKKAYPIFTKQTSTNPGGRKNSGNSKLSLRRGTSNNPTKNSTARVTAFVPSTIAEGAMVKGPSAADAAKEDPNLTLTQAHGGNIENISTEKTKIPPQ